MSGEPEEKQDFKLELAQKKFRCKTSTDAAEKQKLKEEILEVVFKDELAPIYEHLCAELGWEVDADKLAAMKGANGKTLEDLEAKVKDAEENLGDIEVRDALLAKADFLCKIGDKEAAAAAYDATEKKTAGAGLKMDFCFSQIRLAIFHGQWTEVKAGVARAKVLCESGGDWERKNRLKVYEGLLSMATRDFPKAADLFLDSIATFTTTELFPYDQCIFYAVVTGMLVLDRVDLKKRVVDSPEVLTIIHTIPKLPAFLDSLYACKYKEFFVAFSEVIDVMAADMYFAPHVRYYVREMRVKAYSQLLDSYKSVTVASMAAAFGVSEEFLDREVSSFIVAGRLTAKIDKVAGVIETNRADAKNALYQSAIKNGDALLNRIQKLSKVIDVI